MSEWIKFQQYAGFEIAPDASKIRTPEGEFVLRAGKNFTFTNPNTGTKNMATPETLLKRAQSGGVARITMTGEKKPKAERVPKAEKLPKVKGSKKSKLLAGKDELISHGAIAGLMEKINLRKSRNNGITGLEIDDGKNTRMRVLLEKDGTLLVHVEAQNWRDGYWVFNPETNTCTAYIKAEHQPTPGNSGVIWPKF